MRHHSVRGPTATSVICSYGISTVCRPSLMCTACSSSRSVTDWNTSRLKATKPPM